MKTLSTLRQEVSEAKKMKGKDPCWTGYKMLGTKDKGGKQVPNCIPEEVVAEAQTDYQKRRQREKDVDMGKPVKRQPKNPQNDYFARRKKEKELGEAVHRIGLTVTDPNHPMVSKRKETIQKTVRVSGDDKEKAINTAIAHHKRKGYKVHDHHYIGLVNEESDAYEKAQENKRSAEDAKSKSRPFDYHMHMSDHHDNLSQWNYEKGRSNVADIHAKKSEEHHEKAMEMKDKKGMSEEINSIDEISTDGYYTAAAKSRMNAAVKVASSMGQDKQAKTKLDARNRGMKRVEKRTQDDMKKANSGPQRPRPEKKVSDAEARGYGQGRYMGDSYEPSNLTQIYEKNKDAGEYDYEGDMSKSQLRSIIANAQQIHDMLEDNTNMAEWVQSKITLAADYISTVADYMQSEIKEEAKIVHSRTGSNGTKYHIRQDSDNDYSVHREVDGKLKHIDTYGSLQRAKSVLDNEVKEEFESIEEVEQTDESRQVYYINSHKNQDPVVAQAKRLRSKMTKPPMLNSPKTTLKMGEAYSARDRLAMALNKEKKKREDHEAAQAAREAAAKQSNSPKEKIKEGIASLISKNIKSVTATKPTPQQKADIRLNK